MEGRCLGLGIVILALSSCVIAADKDDFRPRERGRSACVDEARRLGYSKVEVQSVRELDRGLWEVIMHGVGATQREIKLSCEYNAPLRQPSVGPAPVD